MKTTKKITLPEDKIPKQWYNILADMPNQPLPLLNPKTREPLTKGDMEVLFAKELAAQEFTKERFIDIPQEVRTLLKIYRPTPLVRASGLEKALDTPAKIYFKNESVSPVGSHKLNTAIPQAYYNKIEGITHLTTETGAGQWGSAMSIACEHFGLDLNVFMVKSSYNAKPYRKLVMKTYGGKVHASPTNITEFGRNILATEPDCGGSLGIAISEAVEMALKTPNCRYVLGSVLNHVLLHQTILGLEAEIQMEMAEDYPTKVIACYGGGSNFAGICFPFLRHNFTSGKTTQFIAAEPECCPKLSMGKLEYDFGDTAGLTPLIPMYTLGHDFQPAQIHAAGLRYHGGGQIVSKLVEDGYIKPVSISQEETFKAGILFSRAEGIIPAPESTHAIAATIREALKAKQEGKEEVLLFNLSGHGLIDMAAYENYLV
ncbi:MAG: TrpB-like pyridoxal phosphate-dependent enzyme [Bacteroidia bacterium]|nr:TrpB-like pyridoxal phosphate-dependent enzyme [Bacteroidia bacterium]